MRQIKIDSNLQDMVKFMYFKRMAQEMDTYVMEFDMLRQKAEAGMITGGGFPDEFAPVLCMQNAALTKNGETWVLASLGIALTPPKVSAQTRRFFGPCGYASRQVVLLAQDMDTVSEREDCGVWMAYREAKRDKRDGGGHGGREKSKSSGRGRAKKAINRRTGERNRC